MRPVIMDHGPPTVRHRIQGELHADLPVCGVEIFAHRHAHLRDWSLVDATASFWRLYWGTRGSAVVIHDGREHALEAGAGLLIPPHTSFSSRCDRPFSKWYIHFTFGGIGNLARPGIYPVARSKRLQAILDRTCPPKIAHHGPLAPDVWRPLSVVELVTFVVQEGIPDLCMTSEVSPHADAVMHLVRERATAGLTLPSRGRSTGLSVRGASRIVKDVTGFTPARDLLELRLGRCVIELKDREELATLMPQAGEARAADVHVEHVGNDLGLGVVCIEGDRRRLAHSGTIRQELHEHDRRVDAKLIAADAEQFAIPFGRPLVVELLPRPGRLRHDLDVLSPDRRGLAHPAALVDERLVECLAGGRDRVPQADNARHEQPGIANPLAKILQAPRFVSYS